MLVIRLTLSISFPFLFCLWCFLFLLFSAPFAVAPFGPLVLRWSAMERGGEEGGFGRRGVAGGARTPSRSSPAPLPLARLPAIDRTMVADSRIVRSTPPTPPLTTLTDSRSLVFSATGPLSSLLAFDEDFQNARARLRHANLRGDKEEAAAQPLSPALRFWKATRTPSGRSRSIPGRLPPPTTSASTPVAEDPERLDSPSLLALSAELLSLTATLDEGLSSSSAVSLSSAGGQVEANQPAGRRAAHRVPRSRTREAQSPSPTPMLRLHALSTSDPSSFDIRDSTTPLPPPSPLPPADSTEQDDFDIGPFAPPLDSKAMDSMVPSDDEEEDDDPSDDWPPDQEPARQSEETQGTSEDTLDDSTDSFPEVTTQPREDLPTSAAHAPSTATTAMPFSVPHEPAADSHRLAELYARFVGNVSNQVVKYYDHSNRITWSLKFDASFESGNLNRVDAVSPFEYDLYIRPDLANRSYHNWFFFSVSEVSAHQKVIFNLVNLSKSRGMYRDGMSVVVRSSSRPHWAWLPPANSFYYHLPNKKQYVLSFAFVFDKARDKYEFAQCFPYTFADLQRLTLRISGGGSVLRRQIGRSVQQRPLELLTITSPGNLRTHPGRPPVRSVFITARVHPGETPASFICEGIIDFLLSDCATARQLRDNLVFKIVPMLNPDGVYHGNYRTGLCGDDLNRCWQNPHPVHHPTIAATKATLMRLVQDPQEQLEIYLDIHGHTAAPNCFIYGNAYEDPVRHSRQWIFPRILSEYAEDFALSMTKLNNDKSKAGTGRRSLGGAIDDHAQCYTLEASMFCYYRRGDPAPVPYTPALYRRLGENVCLAFAEYFAVTEK
eukprot:m.155997 g.155997  ORF g.155997 m.155997 type:complete len:834 (+) comp52927_c2_seq3:1994-4495(+)